MPGASMADAQVRCFHMTMMRVARLCIKVAFVAARGRQNPGSWSSFGANTVQNQVSSLIIALGFHARDG
jgi:hypothetical protein